MICTAKIKKEYFFIDWIRLKKSFCFNFDIVYMVIHENVIINVGINMRFPLKYLKIKLIILKFIIKVL